MNTPLRVAAAEWRWLARQRVLPLAFGLMVALSVVAAVLAWQRMRHDTAERQRFSQQQQHDFDASPDRHPHRMVHYGQFVFRVPTALSAFDPGVDAYTGTAMFLEGHRQNSANFAEGNQASMLLRLSDLSPAFILQWVLPLLLTFAAAGAVAREREGRTLGLLLQQGVRPGALLFGKWLAYAALGLVLMAPMTVLVAALVGVGAWPGLMRLTALHLANAWLWCGLAVGISAWCQRRRDALVMVLGLWLAMAVVVPRFSAVVAARQALATAYDAELLLQQQLKAVGDSHNPDDPHFAAFKAGVLKTYGVATIEQLPINYTGLVSLEGERITSALYAAQMQRNARVLRQQDARVAALAWLSPTLALNRASAALAGTHAGVHAQFLAAAEAHRYAFVQSLNHMHAEDVAYQGDKDRTVSATKWRLVPRFHFDATNVAAPAGVVQQAWRVLACWALLPLLLLTTAARRLRGGA